MDGLSNEPSSAAPATAGGGAPPDDAFAPLVEMLVESAGLPAPEVERRLRAAIPSTLAELVESRRRLREGMQRRDGLLAAATAELRAAAAVLHGRTGEEGERARRLDRLAEELDRALHGPAPDAPPPPRRATNRAHVLVADDEEDAREALRLVLTRDYEVATVCDGEAALDAIRTERPDVVLLDLNMPRLDGLEVLERLRADPSTAEVPVLFVSGHSDDALKVRGLDLGAVDYLQKPFSERELRARVDRTLRLVRSQTALRELAQTDPLTGLSNLRAFRARLDEETKRARRYRTPLTCVMADMDQLKPINDELGHAAGDRAIAAVAAVIREELRETDFGARYGGDEFVVLLPHTGADEGRVFAQRVLARLRAAELQLSGHRVTLGASFGVAALPLDADVLPEILVHAADAALYAAKRAGRGRVVVAEP
jgi:diguanylate cyclase (GGDEF)-like protein